MTRGNLRRLRSELFSRTCGEHPALLRVLLLAPLLALLLVLLRVLLLVLLLLLPSPPPRLVGGIDAFRFVPLLTAADS